MFNLQGSEIIVILLLALVVLGPEKLPDAVRKFTRTYAELKKLGSGFQSELKSALDEPMREMRETANVVREAADPARISAEAEAEKRLRDDAANAQVHHLAPFTASADLPGAPDPEREQDSSSAPQGPADDDGPDATVAGDHHAPPDDETTHGGAVGSGTIDDATTELGPVEHETTDETIDETIDDVDGEARTA